MRFLLGMCALISLPIWAANQVTSQIHDIDHGDHIADEALVFLTSGQVAKINVNNPDLLKKIQRSLQNRQTVTLEVDENREILDISTEIKESLPTEADPLPVEGVKLLSPDPMVGFTPSILSESTVKSYFRQMRHVSKEETQCFNRAHIWSYEMRVKRNVYSNKMWIFFTRKYIRKYNFEWWFHVSPMVHMIVDDQVKERVIDRKYSSGPLSIQKWGNIFLRDDFKCPTVHKYSDHANFPEAGSCFYMKSPMYYYQPVDLEFLEKYGNVLSTWNETHVRQAYAEAFEIYP
jgi:hypothetical protein